MNAPRTIDNSARSALVSRFSHMVCSCRFSYSGCVEFQTVVRKLKMVSSETVAKVTWCVHVGSLILVVLNFRLWSAS